MAAKDVCNLCPEGDEGRRGEVEGGHDPVLLGEAVKVSGDPGQGACDTRGQLADMYS